MVVAGALLLAWLVARYSAVDGLVGKYPTVAAAVAPNDPRVTVALAMAEFRARGGAVTPAAAAAAQRSLLKAPLAEEPFLLAAVDALVARDDARAVRLLREARRRNPRSRTTRLLLLDRSLRAGRVAEAGADISILSNLIPEATKVLVPELAKFAADPATAAALQRTLEADPGMRNAVLEHLTANGADPELILRLADLPAPNGTPLGQAPWQSALMNRLVAEGEVAAAYELWKRFAGIAAPGRKTSVYDGRFEGLPGQPPFNWNLSTGTAGVAERGSGPVLNVDYYGRDAADFATQLLMLPPGRHRLSFQVEGSATGEGSRLGWRLLCNGQSQPLAELPLVEIGYAPTRLATEFTVPANGCASQWLALSGNPGEFPKAQIVTISDVRVEKAGGAS